MKTLDYQVAYESPKAVLLVVESEGVLCGSLNVDHEPFIPGGTIPMGGLVDDDDYAAM